MATDLIVNATSFEIRIALVEYGNLVEFYLERPAEKGLVSNIYKGQVKRVLPGMQAAFVDIGLERTGFLYVDDITPHRNGDDSQIIPCEEDDDVRGCCGGNGHELLPDIVREGGMQIEDLLTEGQEIMVGRRMPRALKSFVQESEVEMVRDDAQALARINVITHDRPGLLAIIGKVLSDKETRLHRARILTEGAIARDAFTVTERNDQPITDPKRIASIQRALREALDG